MRLSPLARAVSLSGVRRGVPQCRDSAAIRHLVGQSLAQCRGRHDDPAQADRTFAPDWTAIAIEFLIVILGVFIGTGRQLERRDWRSSPPTGCSSSYGPKLRTSSPSAIPRGTLSITRRYSNEALAGWNGDRNISDNQFVIAAYQASQISRGSGSTPRTGP